MYAWAHLGPKNRIWTGMVAAAQHFSTFSARLQRTRLATMGQMGQQELEWVRPVIVFHAAIAVKPKASKMYYT